MVLELEGDIMYEPEFPRASFYPWLTTEWYPRHGYLARSTYDMTFRHKKRDSVASVGTLVSEGVDTENKDESLTRWKMDQPVIFATFGVGRFESHAETIETEWGTKLPLVFYSVPGNIEAIKEDFILAEMNNSVRYFSALFGAYSYPKFGGMFQPRGFGQGFPTLLLLPKADRASKYTYSKLVFFEWVYDAHLPSYRLEYKLENQPDGSVIVRGTVLQENVPDDFFMLLPVHFSFGRNQSARTTVHALGPQTPFAMKLPKSPDKVELDPDEWGLSEKTETKRR